MKTKRMVKYSLGAMCAVMLLTNTTWAAPAVGDSEDVLDSIVITATKTEADTKDVPASVTVITAEDIARANVKSVEDILRYQTGFAVKDMGGMKATKVSMRGMSQNGVLVMVDGVSINNGYTGGANWSSVPVEMIERIEIVRGAGSALYGSNAMGGVVNIITKETTGGKVTAGFGSHHTRYGDFYYGLKDNDIFFSVNYGKRTTDGYADDIEDVPITESTYGKRASERETYGVKLAYDVDDENKVILSHQVTENSYGYYEARPTSVPTQEGLRKAVATQLAWQGRYEDGSALNVSLSQYDMDRYWTQTGKNYNPNPVKSREAEANYSWYAGDKHHLTVGASYKQDKGSAETWWPGNVLKDRSGGETENVGFFIQDDISLSDVTNLIIGGRYDNWKFKNGYNMGGEVEEGDQSQFSPKAAINYKANDVTSYYVSVGRAFNSPQLFNLTRLWPMSGASAGYYLLPNANLKPEELMMYEVGAKFDIDGQTSATVSLFQNDVENMIVQADLPSGDAMWDNVGEARIRGIEAEVSHRFSDEWSGFVSYTYNDSEVREYNNAQAIGNQLTTVPEQEFKLGVTHQKNKWTTNLLARYTSEIYESLPNNTKPANMADAVFLMDIKVAYAFDDCQTVSLAVDNLLDREFQCQGFWGDGRAAYMEYSYQF